MNSTFFTILFIILLLVILLIIIGIDFAICRDENRYKCYCTMVFKHKANDFGCLGNNGAPECLNCRYYKNYKRHLEEISNEKVGRGSSKES